MSTYVIGDVQGCYDELRQLLNLIAFDPARDTLWFTGDLVNRGAGSLQTLRFVKSLGNSAITVLGNHDLHLLAIYCGIRPAGKDPTLTPILEAPDVHSLVNWLAGRPVLYQSGDYVMVHAGLHCDWSIDVASTLAREIESLLAFATGPRDEDTRSSLNAALTSLYGASSGTWSKNAPTKSRLCYAMNCFTRMRFCDRQGVPDFRYSGAPGSQPDSLLPWFELQNESQRQHTLLIGHWAAMGLRTVDLSLIHI